MNDDAVYEHFRFNNDDGSSKDWAIAVAPPGLRIRHGKTGAKARLSEVPSENFVGRLAEREMQVRIDSKRAKGYFQVGWADIVDGHLVARSAVPIFDLHWEVASPLEIGALWNAFARLSDALSDVRNVSCKIVNQYQESPGHPSVKTLLSTGLQVELEHRTWLFGQQCGGGLDRAARGGGRVSIHDGAVPILVLMALEREFPGKFRFADDDGGDVKLSIAEDDPFLGEARESFAEVEEIGAKLGLCLGPIRLSESGGKSAGQTSWF